MLMNENKLDFSYESIKDHVVLRLVEIDRCREELALVPYMCVGNGMALVPDIRMEDARGEGFWRTTITREMAALYDYDVRQVFEDAMEDAWKREPPMLKEMENALFGIEERNLLDENEAIGPNGLSRMYILSGKDGVLGASALYYPDVMDKIADKLGDSYSVLPSSIHEVLIVPDKAGISAADLSRMVATANRFVVDEKEVLSDKVLHFDKDARVLGLAMETPDQPAKALEGRG